MLLHLTNELTRFTVINDRSFVMADIPGIIEGASEGKGLGLRFLRHIERNAVLLFMVPATSEDIVKEYKILLNELEQYNPELLTKARILAVTKIDAIEEKELKKLQVSKKLQKLDLPIVFISSVAGMGIDELKDALWTELNKEQNQVIEISHAPIDVTVIERDEPEAREDEEEGTIYLNEVEEEWDLDKYKGIGWDE